MTHFLENLVQRSFGQAAVIQPRPISRFESQELVESPADLTEATTDVGPTTNAAYGPERPLSASSAHRDQTQPDPLQEQTYTPRESLHQTGNSSKEEWQALSARLDNLSGGLAAYRPSQPPTAPPILREQPQTAAASSTLSQIVRSSDTSVGATEQPVADQHQQNELEPPVNSPLSEGIIQIAQPIPSPTQAGRQAGANAEEAQQVDGKGTEVTVVNQWKQEPAVKQVPTGLSPPTVAASNQSNSGKQPQLQPQPIIGAASTLQANSRAEAAPTILRPKIAPFPPATGGPARQRTEVQTPPTINVTIGRIEGRATPPSSSADPKPAKRPRSKSAAMSLDEYLRRRRGGHSE